MALPRLLIPALPAMRGINERTILLLIYISIRCALGGNRSKLTNDSVIPGVTDVEPCRVLTVTYNSSSVGLGTTLTVEETKIHPEVDLNWTCSLTTLVMVDPDAPSRENPSQRFWRHWLIVNIPPKSNVSSGDTITSYEGPSPPNGTGYHRYVFLAYSQNESIDAEGLNASVSQSRGRFNLTTLTSLPQISKLEAVNYFLATNDEHCKK